MPATLYKARAVRGAASRAVGPSQRVAARVSRLEKPSRECIRGPRRLLTRARPLRAAQAKGGNGRAHPGFQAKPLLLTLLEVDQSGRGADEVGTITLNLAEFANAGMGTPHERALLVSLKPGVNMGAWLGASGRAGRLKTDVPSGGAGATGAPELALAVACRMAGSAAGPPPASSLADSDAGRCAPPARLIATIGTDERAAAMRPSRWMRTWRCTRAARWLRPTRTTCGALFLFHLGPCCLCPNLALHPRSSRAGAMCRRRCRRGLRLRRRACRLRRCPRTASLLRPHARRRR